MNEVLLNLSNKIIEQEMTCLVANEKVIYTSKRFGVLPLIEVYQSSIWKTGDVLLLADKLLGKGAALFLIKMGCFKEVYGRVITDEAYKLLTDHGISVYYEKRVPNILNRAKTDLCPIEKIAQDKDITMFEKYYEEIIAFYKRIEQL